MNIPTNMPRFENDKALLIATGKQVGKVYYAANGTVTEIVSLEVPTPVYSDREGFFARNGHGRTYATGTVFEQKDQETKRKFLRQLGTKLKELRGSKDVDEVYVFSPNYAIKELKQELPQELRQKVRFSFMGNFVKFGPMELLKKINQRLRRVRDENQIRSPEEVKILSTAKKQTPRLKFS